MTRRRSLVVIALLVVALAPGTSFAYRPFVGRLLLALLAEWIFVSVLIWWICRITPPRIIRRALLVLTGLLALPLSCGVGHAARDLDFELRRMQKYEAFLATIPRPASCGGSKGTEDAFRVDVPPLLSGDAVAVWAWWESDCALRAEILWSSGGHAGHIAYYYCTGADCTKPGRLWRRYVRLNERWLEVAD